jgi:hypothetical protein
MLRDFFNEEAVGYTESGGQGLFRHETISGKSAIRAERLSFRDEGLPEGFI